MASSHVRGLRNLMRCLLSVAFVLLLGGCGDEVKRLSPLNILDLESAEVEVVQQVEYSRTDSPAAEYLQCTDDEVEIDDEARVDASTVGEQTLPVTMSKGIANRTEDVTFEVVDTKAPTIELSVDALEVEVGEEFELPADLAEAEDPVDGALRHVDEQPVAQGTEQGREQFYDEGWYLVSDDVDTTEAGTYKVEVLASDQHGNETVETIPVTVIDPLEGVTVEPKSEAATIEYGKDKLDFAALVTCSDKEATVTAEPFVPDEIGDVLVPVTLSKHKSTHEETVPATVVDTKKPRIKLSAKQVKVMLGESFDPDAYIVSVTDPVEGKLAKHAKTLKTEVTDVGHEVFYDKGWYRVRGTVDVNTAGTYEIRVKAFDRHGNTALKRLAVTVVDPLEGLKLKAKTKVLEYSSKKVDPAKLVESSIKGAKVSADKLSLTKTGKRKVSFTVTKGNSKRTVDLTFKVRDTKKPKISYLVVNPSIEKGGHFDPYDNIEYVRDPVDGDLAPSTSERSEPGDGWYTITGSHNANVPGKYYYTVIACDRNGNRTTRELCLTVEQPPEPVAPAYDYLLNTNTHKFHYPSCSYGQRTAAHNRWDVHKTRDEVIAMGYSPCQHCWP